MGRILSIDYGQKRVGIAVSDPLKIIANGLTTVPAKEIFSFLDKYILENEVETIVVGYPKNMNNTASESVVFINPFIKKLVKKYTEIKIDIYDERFTSKIAMQTLIAGGANKKTRRKKELTDKISAVIILQSYMESIS